MRDRAATELCNNFLSGTEPFDGLGDRLRLEVEPAPGRVRAGSVPQFRVRLLFEGEPLKAVEDWPTTDCEELVDRRIPDRHFVAAWLRIGPQPEAWDRLSSGRIERRDATSGASDFDLESEGRLGKTGLYRLKVVAQAVLRLGATDLRVATRVLDFEIDLAASTAPPPPSRDDGWVISNTETLRGIVEHVAADGSITSGGRASILFDEVRPLLTVPQRRLVGLDVTTGNLFVGTGAAVSVFQPGGGSRVLDSVAGVSLRNLTALSVDGPRQNLWVAVGSSIIALDLRGERVLRKIDEIAKDLAADPLTGGVWTFAKGSEQQSVLRRYSLDGQSDLVVPTVRDGSAPIPRNPRVCLESNPLGEAVCNGRIGQESALLKVSSGGDIVARTTRADSSVTEPIDLTVHPQTGEVWVVSDFGNRAGLTWYSSDLRSSRRFPFRGISQEGEIQHFWSVDTNAASGNLRAVASVLVKDPVSGRYLPRMLVLERSREGSWSTLAGVTNRRALFLRTF